ncbi:MAG: tRNA pseudouridine(54/55) synthase Pus10 [Methanobacteriota archaeon]|nr:MAG: tRNA pseudouridine(54/55) synthase Pus10 [Euryarchaeota archaeon]
MDEVLSAARSVDPSRFGERTLCDACLGRLFGKIGHGYTNHIRGRAVRELLHVDAGPCWVCEDLTSRYDALADLVVRKLEPWEFDSFAIGSKIDSEVAAREESLWAELALGGPEPLKAEVNREIGKRVSDRLGKEPDLAHPDVVAIVDTAFDHVDVQVNSLYLRGRYRKLVRGVPQTRWPCRRCMGKGCARCGGAGKMYPTSVEEVIANEVLRESGGTAHALHGMGREDVDARMLGRGRPFIIEIKEPRRRHFDLAGAIAGIKASGIVEVDGLAPARGTDVVPLKEDRAAKTYRVLLRMAPPVDEAKLKSTLPVLVAEPIAQRTPERVVHRRADTTRHRRLLAAEVVGVDGDRAELRVTAEAGTYVKEWVHGDRGGRSSAAARASAGFPPSPARSSPSKTASA